MATVKKIYAFSFLIVFFSTAAFGQDYLDKDKRFMKLTEVSTDKTYGFELKNPIKTGTDDKAIGSYLNSLKTMDDDRIHIGDMKFNYKKNDGLTQVVLTFEQKKGTITIYFSAAEFEQPKAITGFLFKTMDDLPKVVVFPADSVLKVTPCTPRMYSVDDFLVKEKLGEMPKPATSPAFTGGQDELKKYFVAHPLTDLKATQMIFRVSVAFVVTCDGKAGNFEIVTQGKGDMETYANQVLAIVNKMPQKWQAATVDGKSVDCYQVLSFTAASGELGSVSFR